MSNFGVKFIITSIDDKDSERSSCSNFNIKVTKIHNIPIISCNNLLYLQSGLASFYVRKYSIIQYNIQWILYCSHELSTSTGKIINVSCLAIIIRQKIIGNTLMRSTLIISNTKDYHYTHIYINNSKGQYHRHHNQTKMICPNNILTVYATK